MNVFLSHLNFMPFIYGVVLFASVFLTLKNFISGQIFRAVGVLAILYIGFQMHGEQSETRMGVAICALLVDLCWPMLFGKRTA
jgi:hypothetical protein